ncbi:MAG: hypothetical protein J5911_04515 [Clostridia bacterium]|nr:hypothetical protein [Clostridia bacterium]
MHNFRKPLIILIAITFIMAAVASVVMLFSVKKVEAEFSVYGDSKALEIQRELDAFKGRNIIFLNTDEMAGVCDAFPYYEVKSIKKEYPNVISLRIEKREEAFKIVGADKIYVLDKDGIVLNDNGETEYPRKVLSVDIGNVFVIDGTVGGKIATSDDELFYSVLKTSRALNLSDSVEKAEIIKSEFGNFRDAVFKTYTGVEITVLNVDDEGEDKIDAAFSYYETITDFKKVSGVINAYKVINSESSYYGKIVAEWTGHTGD